MHPALHEDDSLQLTSIRLCLRTSLSLSLTCTPKTQCCTSKHIPDQTQRKRWCIVTGPYAHQQLHFHTQLKMPLHHDDSYHSTIAAINTDASSLAPYADSL
ncbi:hypothetical protein AMECASPLE_010745 [Ameca splendens]|uniref:Uncharacterized protein n=1 Tax=Ameca splendens TaxID=208324 RepID=A0ABV0YC13_9TELE